MARKEKPNDTAGEQAQEGALAASKTDDVNEAPDPVEDVTDEEIDAALTEKPAEGDDVILAAAQDGEQPHVEEPVVEETPEPATDAQGRTCLCKFTLQEIAAHLVTRTASGSIGVDRGGIVHQCVWQSGQFIMDQGV